MSCRHKAPPTRTNRLPRKTPAGLSVDTSDEPFWSLGLARRVAFAETEAPDTGAIGAKDWSPEDSTWDAEVGELFAFKNDFRGGEDPFSAAITLDQSFSANAGENGNVAVSKVSIRDKDEVRKTSKSSVKKPQRRVTSRDRDRGFSPMLELQRARENIRRRSAGSCRLRSPRAKRSRARARQLGRR